MSFFLVRSCRLTRLFESKKEMSTVFDGRDEGEFNVSRPGHDCGRKVMIVGRSAISVFVAKRAIARNHDETRFLGCLLRIFLRPMTGFLLKRENAPRPCFPFSRLAQDRYSLCCDYASLCSYEFQISVISFRLERRKNFRLNRCRVLRKTAASNIKIREASLLQYREKISPRQAGCFFIIHAETKAS